MSMQPYYTIINSNITDEASGFLSFKLEGDPTLYWAVEYYCVNPKCKCNDVLLSIERSGAGNEESLGSVTIQLSNWKITELELTDPQLKKSKLFRDFMRDLPQDWKTNIKAHRARVMETIRKPSFVPLKPGDTMTSVLTAPSHYEYNEVSARTVLDFEHRGRKITVKEQYCANPDCDCQAAQLFFADVTQPNLPEMKFRIDYSIQNDDYKVWKNFTTDAELDELLGVFKRTHPDARETFIQNYAAVKRVKASQAQPSAQAEPVVKTSRNEPCPCGSGKKFKKCCGA